MRFIAVAVIVLSLAAGVRAAEPDDSYVDIYNEVLLGDNLEQNGHAAAAAEKYLHAQTALQELKAAHPGWNTDVVNFRLDYLAQQLRSLAKILPHPNAAPASPASPGAPAQSEADQLREQIRSLTAANIALENKLKEALSIQPAAVSPDELAKADARNVALQKERDLLAVSLAQAKKSEATAGADKSARAEISRLKDSLADANREIDTIKTQSASDEEQLRARLAVLEAKAVPLTPDELAALKNDAGPAPAAIPTNTVATADAAQPADPKRHVHTVKDLPAGAGPLMADATRANMENDFAGAEAKYEQILREDENNVFVMANLAKSQLAQNKMDAAEKTVHRALELDPEDPASLYLLGYMRYHQNKLDDALNALSHAASLNPTNTGSLYAGTEYYLGKVLQEKGLTSAAETALRSSLAADPDSAEAHYTLAVLYAAEKPPSTALARWHYKRALDLGHPKSAEMEKFLSPSP